MIRFCFFFSSRRRHTRCGRDWSSDVCSSDLAWRTDGAKVRFTWIETNGPPVKGEIKPGFGSKLISRVVSYDLSGTANLDFDREGFLCTLTFPVPPFRTDALRPLSAAEPSPVH